jgi:hypothetical protein
MSLCWDDTSGSPAKHADSTRAGRSTALDAAALSASDSPALDWRHVLCLVQTHRLLLLLLLLLLLEDSSSLGWVRQHTPQRLIGCCPPRPCLCVCVSVNVYAHACVACADLYSHRPWLRSQPSIRLARVLPWMDGEPHAGAARGNEWMQASSRLPNMSSYEKRRGFRVAAEKSKTKAHLAL